MRRRLLRATTALMMAATIVTFAPGAASAGSGLRVEAFSSWALGSGDTAVRVQVDFTLTNLVPDEELEDGSIRRVFFDAIQPGLPREAANVTASANGSPLNVVVVTGESVEGEAPQLSAVISLPGQLFYRETQRVTLRFDLPGSPPRSEGRVRVNPAYAAFDARAWGDPGLAGVEVRVADTYDVTTFGADPPPQRDGEFVVFREEEIADPSTWFLHVSARNDAALDVAAAEVEDLVVSILSWPGDAEWANQVRDLVQRGLPFLREAIGLDYGPVEVLDILQARDPSLLGFAGWYLLDLDRIEMGEFVDEHLVLHELTHIWFNNRLFAERWINEGMAEVFALHAVDSLGLPRDPDHVPTMPDPADPQALPLSEWVFPTVAPNVSETVRAREMFAYNASAWVMAQIVDEIGIAGLRRAIAAADAGEIAYLADADEAEPAEDSRTDWRRLLDLLEERGASDIAEEVFRAHVVGPGEGALLDQRATARGEYIELTAASRAPPLAVRRPLDAWQFDEAREMIAIAADAVDMIDEIDEITGALGLEAPPSVTAAYEGAASTEALLRARDAASRHLTAVSTLADAQAAVEAPRGWLTRIGLIGVDVTRKLTSARSAFDLEQAEVAESEAMEVIAIMAGANDAGRLRAFWAGGGLLILAGLTVTAAVVRRRRRRLGMDRTLD